MKKNQLILAFIFVSNFLSFGNEVEKEAINSLEIEILIEKNKGDLNWYTKFDEAQEAAIKENKPILIYFTGSDWCAPCIMLDEDLFESKRFSKMKNQFILLLVDFPRRYNLFSPEQKEHNDGLMKKYNKKGSFPNITIINSNGKKINGIHGYSQLRDTNRHFSILESIVN